MNSDDILKRSTIALSDLQGHDIDVLTIHKPKDFQAAQHLLKVISKLSPLIGNMLESSLVTFLNSIDDWKNLGSWVRQDPGFPDTIFLGSIDPKPGIEIKTWFPLATEITARFKDSYALLEKGNTNVVVVAWLPEMILYGKPKIIDIWIDSAMSLAEARDKHYHNPPDYLVFEPEDTSSRTINLQQTNTNGYKFQGTRQQLKEAEKIVKKWGKLDPDTHSKEYQELLKTLLGKFTYRLDTNFAKIDRIEHKGLEDFKIKVLNTKIQGHTILKWSRMLKIDDVEDSQNGILKIMAT